MADTSSNNLSSRDSQRQAARHELPSLSSSLLERVQQMQPEAWGRLVEVYTPIVYRWCRQMQLSPTDAGDIVQEVFISVARGIGTFERQREDGSFRAWLATICRNRIRDHWRRQGKQPRAAGGTDAMQMMQNLEESLDHSVSEGEVNRALPRSVLSLVEAEFEPRTWQAFWQTTIDGKSPQDVAIDLKMNVASVYQAKSRVLRRLRRRLEELP